MPLPNSIIATLSPNSSRQVTFILRLHGWTHKHPTPEAFPAVEHLVAALFPHTWEAQWPEAVASFLDGNGDFV
jgi:hypothetical protein